MLQAGLPSAPNEWHFSLPSTQYHKTQELDFKRPLVQIQRPLTEGTDATKGQNELRKTRAALTALAKHYKTTQQMPQHRACHNKDPFSGAARQLTSGFTLTPVTASCLLPTATLPVPQSLRENVSGHREQIKRWKCVCTCKDTLLLACILLLPRRNRCEDGYVCSKAWSEPASAACHWWK